MAFVCKSCSYYDGGDANPSRCSHCGGEMRFTMFDPRGTATATLEPPSGVNPGGLSSAKPGDADWEDPYKYGYEEIEAPWAFRYAQIGAGITTYFVVSRLAIPFILLPFAYAFSESEPQIAVLAVAGMALVLYCLAAIGGGAVAGFWAQNWLPQGLGVAGGVLFIPLICMLVFTPDNWLSFCITLVMTSIFTVVGAFLGHLFVRPTRIPKS